MPSDTKASVHRLTSLAGRAVTALRFEGDIASTSKDAVLGSYQSLPKETVKLVLLDFSKVDYINSSGIALGGHHEVFPNLPKRGRCFGCAVARHGKFSSVRTRLAKEE